MVGDMDNNGSLNAQIIHQITNRIRSKVAFQVYTTLTWPQYAFTLRVILRDNFFQIYLTVHDFNQS